ncbi:hypothetical protein GCM10009111_03810 [Colwellia asteriadis]|uniref:Transposase n=1 Tax=Colwellia asteriadis TaxID=517723 RepID=A0ABN1L307_9GAMM
MFSCAAKAGAASKALKAIVINVRNIITLLISNKFGEKFTGFSVKKQQLFILYTDIKKRVN